MTIILLSKDLHIKVILLKIKRSDAVNRYKGSQVLGVRYDI